MIKEIHKNNNETCLIYITIKGGMPYVKWDLVQIARKIAFFELHTSYIEDFSNFVHYTHCKSNGLKTEKEVLIKKKPRTYIFRNIK